MVPAAQPDGQLLSLETLQAAQAWGALTALSVHVRMVVDPFPLRHPGLGVGWLPDVCLKPGQATTEQHVGSLLCRLAPYHASLTLPPDGAMCHGLAMTSMEVVSSL